MIYLKFPMINRLLIKDTAELEEDNPKRGVVVMHGYAIAVRDRDIVFFNLKDYFVVNEKIQEETKIKELDDILDFMNGNMFSSEFWAELTKGATVTVNENKLELLGTVRKDLIYQDVKHFDSFMISAMLKQNISTDAVPVPRKSFYVSSITDVLTTFKSMLKDSAIAVESTGMNTTIRYTFDECPWLFGIMNSEAALAGQQFIFNNAENLNIEINTKK